MPANCAYSFADLYQAAHGRPPSTEQLEDLYALPQELRNDEVRQWAKQADWTTEDVKGGDGLIYTSFGPTSRNTCSAS
jgi:hypothetical protein